MNRTMTINEVWLHLSEGKWVNIEQPPEISINETNRLPWYVAGLVGISGWVAAGFLISFLAMADLLNNAQTMLLIGIAFCVAALAIKYAARHAIFPSQLAFALSLAGQSLIIGSRTMAQFDGGTAGSIGIIVLTVLILEGLLFILYPDALHRLISLSAIIIALVVQLDDWSWNAGISVFALLLATGAFVVWWQQMPILLSRLQAYFAPLSIGLPLGALGLCIAQLGDTEFFAGPWWITAIGSALFLLLLGGLVLRDLTIPLLPIAGVGIMLLTLLIMIIAYKTPGMMVAVLMVGLAYWRGNRLLFGISLGGVLLFISAYYYNLELTLLMKSLLLMGSGVGLLLLRIGLGWLTQKGSETA